MRTHEVHTFGNEDPDGRYTPRYIQRYGEGEARFDPPPPDVVGEPGTYWCRIVFDDGLEVDSWGRAKVPGGLRGIAEAPILDLEPVTAGAAIARSLMGVHFQARSIAWIDNPTADEWGTVKIGEWGGWNVAIMPMIFNDRLVLIPQSDPMSIDHGWCFPKGGAAIMAALVWDMETDAEPSGYIKAVGFTRKAGQRAE